MEKEKNNNQSIIRGIAAFFILLSHISEFTDENCIFRVFTPFGYFCVAIFFFYSGFNLMNNFINKEKFFKKYWYKKFTKIYIPFLISNILFIIIKTRLSNKNFLFPNMIYYIFGIKCVNISNWYIYSIMIFYMSAFIVLLLINNFETARKNKILLTFSAFLIFIMHTALYCRLLDDKVAYITLLLGMLVSIFNKEIKKFYKNDLLFEIFVIFCLIVTCTLHFAYINKIEILSLDNTVIKILASTFFTILIMLISTKLNLKSKIFSFTNKISLETYVFHFVILNLYYNKTFKIENSYLFLLVYLITTIIISIIIKKLIDLIFYKKNKKGIYLKNENIDSLI